MRFFYSFFLSKWKKIQKFVFAEAEWPNMQLKEVAPID